MVEYSAKHYQIKSEKSAVRAEDAANRAEEYANSLEPETFVKTSGNQTWTGVKTAKHANIQIQCSVADDTATSITSNEERGLLIVDKDGARIGNFFSGQITDGKIRTYMCSARNVSGTMKYQYADIRQNVDGTGNFNIACTSATSPTPAKSDNSTKIATTAWVWTCTGGYTHSYGISSSANPWQAWHEVKDKNGNRVLLEQWFSARGSTPATWTFAKPFTSYVFSGIGVLMRGGQAYHRGISGVSLTAMTWVTGDGYSNSQGYVCGR